MLAIMGPPFHEQVKMLCDGPPDLRKLVLNVRKLCNGVWDVSLWWYIIAKLCANSECVFPLK